MLQREIIAGGYRPGQRLVERGLVRRFGVSSIPIREALVELEGRGLVARRHNCGCSVIQLTTDEAIRICELRRVLEPRVMEWAAEGYQRICNRRTFTSVCEVGGSRAKAGLCGVFPGRYHLSPNDYGCRRKPICASRFGFHDGLIVCVGVDGVTRSAPDRFRQRTSQARAIA